MAGSSPNRFFARHAKSSAVFTSLVVHGLLVILAMSFVAFSVVQKEDQHFVEQKVIRPRLQPRKLSIPVSIRKKTARNSAMRNRIVVRKELKTAAIQLPEMSDVGGGFGYLGAGVGLGGLETGFGVDFFGIMGGGDHIVFIIDYSISMAGEKEGIMRREVARIIRALPRDTHFNIIFFAGPAWSASSGFNTPMNDWVQTGNDAFSFRPKNWNNMPKVRYVRASRITTTTLINKVETTPLAWGTVYDIPIYMALSMTPMPDTIFFMTDGMCAEERGIISLRKMVDQLNAAGKKVPVMHTVGFGITENYQLEEMARLMGGECHFLTARDYVKKYGPKKFKRGRQSSLDVFRAIKSVPPDQYPVEFSLQ